MPHMPLSLYRRHRQECKGDHPHNSRTSEYEERKKGCPAVEIVFLAFSRKRSPIVPRASSLNPLKLNRILQVKSGETTGSGVGFRR